MNHQRHIIREAIVALLAGAGTAAGTRVYDHPYDPRTSFPALTVEDGVEQQQTQSMPAGPGRPIERTLVLVISAEVQQTANYARTRDQLLAEVESLLASAAIVGVKAITPAGYQPDLNVEGERPIAVGRQRFEVLYYTAQGTPATPL